MKKRDSKLAIVSFVLALAAVLFLSIRAPGSLAGAIPVGLVATCIGVFALRSIRRARGSLRGKGLAVAAVCLGMVTPVFSILFIIGMVLQQIGQQQRWQHARDQGAQLERKLAVNPFANEPATNFTSNLPIVVLRTGGRSISKDELTVVRVQFHEVRHRQAAEKAAPDYDGLATIRLRGNTSLHLPKRSYTLHTVDDQNKQTKVSLLGLPAEEDWVLYAPFEDKTLMRDVLAFELANQMGQYAPRTRYVELFISASERPVSMRDYAGVYVLIEKIKRGKDRVNIAKLEPRHRAEPEITGGYIVKRDHGDSGERRFHTDHGGPYFYVYPKPETITSEQRSWLTRYFKSFEAALYGPDFADRETGYAAYLDVEAFIDAHWLIELSKNVDGFRYSAFLTKDRGGKLKAGPPWDWNRAFGNANYYGGWQTHGWYWSNLRPNEISWYLRLREDPYFLRRCNARWIELRKDVFNPKKIHARIDEIAAQLDEAQERNYKRWPVLGQHVTCNHYVGQSFDDEVRWLKNWIERRVAWIDGQVGLPSNL